MKGKSYHHGNLRATLIEAAIGLIRELGPDGFTLREVARRAKVSHTAPYRHFRDRDELLVAVVEQGFTELHRAMAEASTSARTPLEGLRRCGEAYVDFALASTAHFLVMFRMVLDAERHPSAYAAGERAFEVLLNAVRACQEVGSLPAGSPQTAALIAWSLVHGIAHLAIGKQFGFKSEAEMKKFMGTASDALIAGLRSGFDTKR